METKESYYRIIRIRHPGRRIRAWSSLHISGSVHVYLVVSPHWWLQDGRADYFTTRSEVVNHQKDEASRTFLLLLFRARGILGRSHARGPPAPPTPSPHEPDPHHMAWPGISVFAYHSHMPATHGATHWEDVRQHIGIWWIVLNNRTWHQWIWLLKFN